MAGAGSVLMMATQAASAVGGLATSYAQSKAQSSQGSFVQQQYESNRQIAEIQSQDAIRRGEKDASDHRKRVRRLIGAQRAALAAQGIEVNDDSALDIQLDTAGEGAMDELTIKNNAWRESWGYRVQANDYAMRGAMAASAARNESRNTLLTGGLTFARNLIEIGSTYKKLK